MGREEERRGGSSRARATETAQGEPSQSTTTQQAVFDERRIIALDSIAIRRGWETETGEHRFFHGLLGASLSVFEAKDFVGQYQGILEDLFKKHLLPREKLSYKAAEIYTLLQTKPRAADAFVHEFATRLLGIKGPKLNLFVGTFDISAMVSGPSSAASASVSQTPADVTTSRVVPIYGNGAGIKMITVPELIDKLENPFPAISAWKLTQVTRIYKQQFLIDHFEGEESLAWQDLIANNSVFLVPKGSACNPYISAIDIFLRSVNRVLERKFAPFTPQTVGDAVSLMAKDRPEAETHVHHVSNDDVYMIKPVTPKQIQGEAFVKHPVFFVFNEQDVKGEREEIDQSPMMKQLHDLAYEKLGGVLFYKAETSTKVIRQGDFFVTYGSKGEEAYKRLKRLGYELNLIKK